MTAPRQQLHQQTAANAPPDTIHSWQGVSEHAPATVETDCLAEFFALAHGIQHGPAAEHSSEKPTRPACGTRDNTLPKCAGSPESARNAKGVSHSNSPDSVRETMMLAAETRIAQTQRPIVARKVRSVMRREDILEELHVAVRLRETQLSRGPKLQSTWD
jgi:hypothetical protein